MPPKKIPDIRLVEEDESEVKGLTHTISLDLSTLNANFPQFSGSDSEDVIDFIREFERAASLQSITDEKKKTNKLLAQLTGNAKLWSYSISEEDKSSYERMKECIKSVFSSPLTDQQRKLLFRTKLFNRKQLSTETVNDFAIAQSDLARRADVKDTLPEVVELFIEGLLPSIREQVTLSTKPTDERKDIIQFARRVEAIQNGSKSVSVRLIRSTDEAVVEAAPVSNIEKILAEQQKQISQLTKLVETHMSGISKPTKSTVSVEPVKKADTGEERKDRTDKKSMVCFWCQKRGHRQHECRSRLAGKPRVPRPGQVSAIATPQPSQSFYPPPQSWYYPSMPHPPAHYVMPTNSHYPFQSFNPSSESSSTTVQSPPVNAQNIVTQLPQQAAVQPVQSTPASEKPTQLSPMTISNAGLDCPHVNFSIVGYTKPLATLIDTGSPINCMSTAVYNSITPIPSLRPFGKKLLTVDERPIDGVLGECSVCVLLPDSTQLVLPFVVLNKLPRSASLLLGWNSYRLYRGHVDSSTLTFAGCNFPLIQSSVSAIVVCNINLPPRSISVHSVQLQQPSQCSTEKWLLECNEKLPSPVSIVPTVIDSNTDLSADIKVNVVNHSSLPISLERGTALAYAYPVDIEKAITSVPISLVSSTKAIPSALSNEKKKAFEQLVAHLDDDKRKDELKLLYEFADLFSIDESELGRTDWVEHEIKLLDNAEPSYIPPRRLAPVEQLAVDREIELLLKYKLIEPSDSPWSSPVLIVRKKDGTFRMVVDYRRLNSQTVNSVYPLPDVQEVLQTVASHTWYSSFDSLRGYHQVPISPSSRPLTAFSVRGKYQNSYQWIVLPFGLRTAPSTYQKLTDKIVRPYSWSFLLGFFDDCLVYSDSWMEHLTHQRLYFERVRLSGITLKISKCRVCRGEVSFLGHLISLKGISPDPDKISAILDYPCPTNVATLRSFLGLTGYYREYVANYSGIAAPLYRLTKKDSVFMWDSECTAAFEQLKTRLTQPPILSPPDYSIPFVLYTDASTQAIGAVLEQKDKKVIGYFSKILNSSQRRYTITQLECLAVVSALKHFRGIIYGQSIRIYTDHQALKWLLSTSHPPGMLARWALFISEFNVDIQYRPGVQHRNADALTRQYGDHTAVGTVTRQQRNLLLEQQQLDMEDANEEDELKSDSDTDSLLEEGELLDDSELESASDDDGEVVESNRIDESKAIKLSVPSLKELQLADSELKVLIDKLSSGEPVPSFALDGEGVLVRTSGEPPYRVVAPKSMIQELLYQAHDGVLSAHLGSHKTYRRLVRDWYWKGMQAAVNNYCQSCIVCQQRNSRGGISIAQFRNWSLTSGLHTWSMDFLGPLELCRFNGRQYRYILVINDLGTKWVEIIPTPNQKASTVATALMDRIVCRFGVPVSIISDRGSSFINQVIHNLMEQIGSTHQLTSGYHPQSNGTTERFNRTLADCLSKFVNEKRNNWVQYLPFIQFSYNSSVHKSTNHSPFYLLYGRCVRLPTTLYPSTVDSPADADELVDRLSSTFIDVHRQLAQQQSIPTDAQYSVGDLVWYKDVTNPLKLGRPWKGPYRITAILTAVTYRITPIKGRVRHRLTVHSTYLKPYHLRTATLS